MYDNIICNIHSFIHIMRFFCILSVLLMDNLYSCYLVGNTGNSARMCDLLTNAKL